MKKRSKRTSQIIGDHEEIQQLLQDKNQIIKSITKPKIKKSEAAQKRDRHKARLSQLKERLLKSYLRTLPQVIKNTDSSQNINHISMKQAIQKLIHFQNTHTRKKKFSLPSIHQQLKVFFWSFVLNLQSYNFEQLSNLDQKKLMNHHNEKITEKNVDNFIKRYFDQNQEDNQEQKNYDYNSNFQYRIQQLRIQQEINQQRQVCQKQNKQQGLWDVLNEDIMQEQNAKSNKNEIQNRRTYNNQGTSRRNTSIMIFMALICMICLGLRTTQQSNSSVRICLQQDNNINELNESYMNASIKHIQYGLNMSHIPRLGENIKTFSEDIILLGVLILSILFVICICITGLLYLKRMQDKFSYLAENQGGRIDL